MLIFLVIVFMMIAFIALRVAQTLVKQGHNKLRARFVFGFLGGIGFAGTMILGEILYDFDLVLIDVIILTVIMAVVLFMASYGSYNLVLDRRFDLLEPTQTKGLLKELKESKKELYVVLVVTLIPLITIGFVFLLIELLS